MGAFKAIKPGKNRPFELYDLSKDPGELNNIAAEHTDIIAKMTEYARQSHTENLVGNVLDKEKRFIGHKAK